MLGLDAIRNDNIKVINKKNYGHCKIKIVECIFMKKEEKRIVYLFVCCFDDVSIFPDALE